MIRLLCGVLSDGRVSASLEFHLGYLGDEFRVEVTIQLLSSVYDVAFDDDER